MEIRKAPGVELQFAIGVAGLLAANIARGVRTRHRGRRRRAAAYTLFERPGGGVVEVDHRRPPDAGFGVVFLNGLGLPHEQWAWVRGFLPADAACVGYNRPGHGLSGPLRGATLEDQFRIVDELREHYLHGLPVVLVGHSLGGYLAAAYAASRGNAATHGTAGLSHVVMVDPTIIADLRAGIGRLPDWWTRQRLLMECLWAAMGLNILRPMSPVRDSYADDVRDSLTAYHAWPRVWATAYREYMAARDYPPVGKLTVPLHVVGALKGTRSALGHRTSQETMLELSDSARHHVLDDADHMGVVAERTHARTLAGLVVPGSMS